MGESTLSTKRPGSPKPEIVKALLSRVQSLLETAGLQTEVRASADDNGNAIIAARRGRERHALILDAAPSGEPRRALETIGRAHLKEESPLRPYWILGAPYVSERTAEFCRRGGVGYIDLVGNFELRFGPFVLASRLHVDPKRERKVQKTLFSPRASRVSLAFLLEPETRWTQRALAETAQISIGLVNRTVRALGEQRFVAEEEGRWHLADRDALLAAWLAHYGSRPRLATRFLAQGSLEEIESRLDRDASERRYRYALARESAAKYRASFAPALQLAFYCDASPAEVGARLGIKPVDYGWNVEILLPPDEGVFFRSRRIAVGGGSGGDAPGMGRTLTNDIYLYLDLATHPARGKEQAEHLLEIVTAEPPPRTRSTEQNARYHRFLELREQAHAAMREENWNVAVNLFDQSLEEVKSLADDQAVESRETETFHRWLAMEHGILNAWDRDPRFKRKLLKRLPWDIPDDERVLDRFPPFRMLHALVRYLLGTRHAILAATGKGADREHHARVAVQHFKIALSPYTEGANRVARDVEEVREWLRRVADIDLAL